MKKTVLVFIVKTLLILFSIALIYYLFVLLPTLILPRKIFEIRKNIVGLQSPILQSRISFVALTRLDPKTPDFVFSYDKNLENINKSSEKILEIQKNLPKFPAAKNMPQKLLDFNRDLSQSFPALVDKQVETIGKQKALLEELSAYHQIVQKVYLYDIFSDIGSLNLSDNSQKELAQARAKETINGLERIATNLKASKFEEEKDLFTQIRITEEAFLSFASSPAKTTLEKAKAAFDGLKIKTYEVEKEILTSKEGLSLLTDETNILLKLNFYLTQLETLQTEVLKPK